MIANLNGIYETVEYTDGTGIMLYDNRDVEEYPRHWHTAIEIIMPVHGIYEVECDGREYHLRPGDILLICPGALHHLLACEGERWIFQAEMSAVTQLDCVSSFLTLLYPCVLVAPDMPGMLYHEFSALFLDITKEYQGRQTLYPAVIHGKLLEMMTALRRSDIALESRQIAATGTKQKEYIEKFTDVCNYIGDNCVQDLTLDQIADRAGFSKYHFSRLFKQFTGISFYKYLNQRRIEHAEKLLIDPEKSITEVCLASGFTSQSSFIRMFKLVKGCTPSEYRAQYNP